MRGLVLIVLVVFLALLGLNAQTASAQEAQLVVTVLDDFGQPFPDARVEVRLELPARSPADVRPPTRLVATANTDALGAAVIRLQPFRSYRTRVVREGFTTSEHWDRQYWTTPGETIAAPYRLSALFDVSLDSDSPSAQLPNGILSGRVLSTTGDPVRDVVVTINPFGSIGYTAPDVRTTADGSYRVALPPGRYAVNTNGSLTAPLRLWSRPTVVVFDRAPQDVRAVVSSRKETLAPDLVVTLIRLVNTKVTVLDEQGNAVSGAQVRYTAASSAPAYFFQGHVPTSADGSVMLGPHLPGEMHVIASASKGAAHFAASTKFEIVDAPQELTLQLLPAARVTGRVDFIGRATPLTGGGLRIHDVGLDGSPAPHQQNDRRGLVEPDGAFTLTNLIGERCLKVDGVSYGWHLVDITYNGEDYTDRPFRLEAGEEITGVLVRFQEGTDEPDSRHCSR